MNESTTTPNDVFLNVRKAYRLLHDYQQMVIDGVRYVATQLDIEPNVGCARFAEDAKSGWRYLNSPSWDWLPMMVWEFHFVKATSENQVLSLSVFIASDTGYYDAEDDSINKAEVSSFVPANQSTSRVAVMLRRTPFTNFPFMNDKREMGQFLKLGSLPPDLTEQGFVGESYDMACFLSEAAANQVVERILGLAKQHGMPLERAFKPS